MVNIENISDINLSPIEYCYISGDQDVTSKTFKVRVPKIMTSLLDPLDSIINKNIFINAKECKPSVNHIKLQTYITVPKSNNCSFTEISKDNKVKNGTRILCNCMNSNIKDITIIDYDSEYTAINKSETLKITDFIKLIDTYKLISEGDMYNLRLKNNIENFKNITTTLGFNGKMYQLLDNRQISTMGNDTIDINSKINMDSVNVNNIKLLLSIDIEAIIGTISMNTLYYPEVQCLFTVNFDDGTSTIFKINHFQHMSYTSWVYSLKDYLNDDDISKNIANISLSNLTIIDNYYSINGDTISTVDKITLYNAFLMIIT